MTYWLDNKMHGAALAKEAKCIYNPAVDVVISHSRDGELLGGVIYQDYTKTAIVAHVAGFDKHWLSRDMLWLVFDYPFVQLGVKKIIGQIPASNLIALEFNTKLGFTPEARIRDVYPDGDLIIMSIYKDSCRWLKLKPRRIQRGGNGEKI